MTDHTTARAYAVRTGTRRFEYVTLTESDSLAPLNRDDDALTIVRDTVTGLDWLLVQARGPGHWLFDGSPSPFTLEDLDAALACFAAADAADAIPHTPQSFPAA